MNHIMRVSTIAFKSCRVKLDWANRNLDEYTYRKVEKSYKDIIKYTTIMVLLLCLIYFITLISQVNTLDKYSADSTRTAHVSGEKIWYVQNDKKEIDLSDYGYNYKNYFENEKFIVFLDQNYNVISISPLKDIQKEKNAPFLVMIGGLILIIIIFCIYLPICYKTFGKNWRKFGKWYEKANLSNDKLIL